MEETAEILIHGSEEEKRSGIPYMYVFVRKDLSPEQMVVQTAHAASEASVYLFSDIKGCHLIVLGVKDERELIRTMHYLNTCDLQYVHFVEPDMNGGEITALATQIVRGVKRDLFSHFELLTVGKKKGLTVRKHLKKRARKK